MSGHAYFGENVTKIKHISFCQNGEMKKIKRVWYYHNGVYRQVWTGASTVSYYDGDTLLGTEEVDEGDSILHPQTIDTTKTGYTLYGWKASASDTTRLDEMLATGEPISVYAYYVPNTLDVLVASFGNWSYDSGGWHMPYSVSVRNAKYITGGTDAFVSAPWSTRESSTSFYLALNEYQSANVTVQGKYCPNDTGNLNVGQTYFDGDGLSSWNLSGSTASKAYSNVKTGNHSIRVVAIAYGDYWQAVAGGVTRIRLINPTPWE